MELTSSSYRSPLILIFLAWRQFWSICDETSAKSLKPSSSASCASMSWSCPFEHALQPDRPDSVRSDGVAAEVSEGAERSVGLILIWGSESVLQVGRPELIHNSAEVKRYALCILCYNRSYHARLYNPKGLISSTKALMTYSLATKSFLKPLFEPGAARSDVFSVSTRASYSLSTGPGCCCPSCRRSKAYTLCSASPTWTLLPRICGSTRMTLCIPSKRSRLMRAAYSLAGENESIP